MPEGYTYENTTGGWQVCNRCGVQVSDTEKHDAWHRANDKPTPTVVFDSESRRLLVPMDGRLAGQTIVAEIPAEGDR